MPSTEPDAALATLAARLDRLLDRVEPWLPPVGAPDFSAAAAFRWRRAGAAGWLVPVHHPHHIRLEQLHGVDDQKALLDRNTRQFVAGHPANNVLLTGARGTGKSSLVKGVFNRYAKKGLRLIEVDRVHLSDLPDIADLIAGRRERFILFCDDLAFGANEVGFQALKAVLDGSVASQPDNLLVYATSNRRHLMPEFMAENLEARHLGGEVHPGEASEEKVSLSERFGLWLSFHPFDQDAYLDIARRWLDELGVTPGEDAPAEALRWALARGSRSGRVAWQFARDYAGRMLSRGRR